MLKPLFLGGIGMFLCLATERGFGQSFKDPGEISGFIEELKKDPRGPYRDIKWFCEDGSIRDARDPCPRPSPRNVQHARYKESVLELARQKHIYFGQILTGTGQAEFWDQDNGHSRLKQYIMEQYLFEVDDGWVLRKAQYYRGAKQAEDENAWGRSFLIWALSSDERLLENYLLLRLAVRYVPHGEEKEQLASIRLLSTRITQRNNAFMDLRTKIHNSPDRTDLDRVIGFSDAQCDKLDERTRDMLEELMAQMFSYYDLIDPARLREYSALLSEDPAMNSALQTFWQNMVIYDPAVAARSGSELLHGLKDLVAESTSPQRRLRLLEMGNFLEDQLVILFSGWKAEGLAESADKLCHLTRSLEGCGYLAGWEYANVFPTMASLYIQDTSLAYVELYRKRASKIVLWSSQMLTSLFDPEIKRYEAFAPVIGGLPDHLIRSSVILSGGQAVQELNRTVNELSNVSFSIMGKEEGGNISGLNPGIAVGELQVVRRGEEVVTMADKIYIFQRPPDDLKPVAGIATIEEGNPVSHVQLLARNIGIPNAVLDASLMDRLEKYEGTVVFYAVSPGGGILMKPASDMTSEEEAMISEEKHNRTRIRVETGRLVLTADTILDLSRVDARLSGRWCGPKAANLGQLKKMFPEHVVDGLILPFGEFRAHMEQRIPGKEGTYWEFLAGIFNERSRQLIEGTSLEEVEQYVLEQLSQLRTLIESMPFRPGFVTRFENKFEKLLGGKPGTVPVFLRSDTNMEDLEEFTGAGLNLTLFNVLDRQAILDGIRKVWASPYSERSYRWRQFYLENPEDVYPSILIIPSVNVDKSGVLITTGLHDGIGRAVTAAFSRGAGGAVEGQSAETWELYPEGLCKLVSPSRERKYRVIPPTGGTELRTATLNYSILSSDDMWAIVGLTENIRKKVEKETGMQGPYDVELGFREGKLWLFQIRPFVENKTARFSAYLANLDPDMPEKTVKIQ